MQKRTLYIKVNTLPPSSPSTSHNHQNCRGETNRLDPQKLTKMMKSRSKSKGKTRKSSSSSLFKEAHIAKNGETYLCSSPSESDIASKRSKRQGTHSSKTKGNLTDLKKHKSDSNFEIKKVMNINIANAPSSESDLTRLIIQQLGSAQQTIAGMSMLEPIYGDKQLVKRLSSTNESIRNILNIMKQ